MNYDERESLIKQMILTIQFELKEVRESLRENPDDDYSIGKYQTLKNYEDICQMLSE